MPRRNLTATGLLERAGALLIGCLGILTAGRELRVTASIANAAQVARRRRYRRGSASFNAAMRSGEW